MLAKNSVFCFQYWTGQITIPEDQDISQSSRLAGGKWRSHLSEVDAAGIISWTDRFLLRWASAILYQPRFPPLIPCTMALFMPSSWRPSGRTEGLTLPISLAYDLKQPRILHARIQKLELNGESQLLFLGPRWCEGSIFSYTSL